MKGKGNKRFCLGDFESLSPGSLSQLFSYVVLSNKGLVSVQCKHVKTNELLPALARKHCQAHC